MIMFYIYQQRTRSNFSKYFLLTLLELRWIILPHEKIIFTSATVYIVVEFSLRFWNFLDSLQNLHWLRFQLEIFGINSLLPELFLLSCAIYVLFMTGLTKPILFSWNDSINSRNLSQTSRWLTNWTQNTNCKYSLSNRDNDCKKEIVRFYCYFRPSRRRGHTQAAHLVY